MRALRILRGALGTGITFAAYSTLQAGADLRSVNRYGGTALIPAAHHGHVEVVRLLLDNDSPIVFHCTAGKDRTGFAAALILLTLGVPRNVVMHDYLLTNALYQRPPGMGSHAPEEVLRVLWRVQEEFLDAALHMVDNDFGGLQAYLVDVLGVDAAAQKELAGRYLQAA